MAGKHGKLVVIDGNALIHRSFHALPPLTTRSGQQVNAAYGFTSILLRVMRELHPEYWAVTFDLRGPTFRHKAYKEYKATRVKAPQELYDQIPIVKRIVESFHIPIFEKEGFEADDVIGTIVRRPLPVERIIVTGDNDTLQLINDDVKVYTLRKGLGETALYDAAAVKERYGLNPDQLIDYKALRGDPSDNIPGVKGIGEKTAVSLLQQFKTLEALFAALDSDDEQLTKVLPRIQELLRSHRAEAKLSKELGTIVTDVPMDFSLETCAVQHYDRAKVADLFRELEFASLLNKLPTDTSAPEPENKSDKTWQLVQRSFRTPTEHKIKAASPKRDTHYRCILQESELRSLVAELRTARELAVDTETTDLGPFRAKLVGLSLSWRAGEAAYLPLLARPELERSAAFTSLKEILIDPKIAKIGHNLKFDLCVLERAGIPLAPLSFDTMVAAYLLNPGTRRYSLSELVFTEFGIEMQPIEALIGPKTRVVNGKKEKQKTMAEVPLDEISAYACADADMTFRLKARLAPQLEKKNVAGLFATMEMPLVRVLADMERVGITLDTARLKKLSRSLTTQITALEKKIYQLAGVEFNINSPLQLKEILFERLQIETKGIGKTKTGLSTAASELEKMKHLHPIIERITEYRELAKLKNTYLDALPEMADPDTQRIHTSFNQTIAATGRLSSSDPNLQNIPIRTSLGNEIRKAFIAGRGQRIISIDYSQIELRVIASVANDPAMIGTFERGEDIHTRTAAAIHEVPLEQVTKELRRTAKAVNFGVIYGLGPVGLAEQQGITREKAKEFIAKYFEAFPKVREWIDNTKLLARTQGYVETLFGRRRYLPEINSPNHMLASQAERIAVNMPIQGTAADLMKLAMLKVAEDLPRNSPAPPCSSKCMTNSCWRRWRARLRLSANS